ncbi:MAG: hypothetical protein M3460_00850 [Actinomycetota bacterium]|nr:hypothetical protein [Actinomycetota bacterium]
MDLIPIGQAADRLGLNPSTLGLPLDTAAALRDGRDLGDVVADGYR